MVNNINVPETEPFDSLFNSIFNYSLTDLNMESEGNFGKIYTIIATKFIEIINPYIISSRYILDPLINLKDHLDKKQQTEFNIQQLKGKNNILFNLFRNFNESTKVFIDIKMYFQCLENFISKISYILKINNFFHNNSIEYINININLNKNETILEVINNLLEILNKININEIDNKEIFDFINFHKNNAIKNINELNVEKNKIIIIIMKNSIIFHLKIMKINSQFKINKIINHKIEKISNEIHLDYSNFNQEQNKFIVNSIDTNINNIHIFEVIDFLKEVNNNDNTIIIDNIKNTFNNFLENLNEYTNKTQEKFMNLNLRKQNQLKRIDELLEDFHKEKKNKEYLDYIQNYNKINKLLITENKRYALYKYIKNKTIFKTNKKNKNNQFSNLLNKISNQNDIIKNKIDLKYCKIVNIIGINKNIDL